MPNKRHLTTCVTTGVARLLILTTSAWLLSVNMASATETVHSKLFKAAKGKQATSNNKVTFLIDGTEIWPKWQELINNAKKTIEVNMYLWADDEVGIAAAQMLRDAVKRGVRVRVITEGTNPFKHDKVFEILKSAGIVPLIFSDASRGMFRLDYHLHEKYMVIDGTIGVTGGVNFVDEYMLGLHKPLWHDLSIIVEGSEGIKLQRRYDHTWDQFAGQDYVTNRDYARFLSDPNADVEKYYPILGQTPIAEADKVRTFGSDAAIMDYQQPYFKADEGKRLEKDLISMMKSAEKRLVVYAPYLLLEKDFEQAILDVADAGIEVTVFTNSLRSNDLNQFVTRATYKPELKMLKHGVKVYEKEGSTQHAKAILVDDKMVSVGSNNFTHRSFKLNGELSFRTSSDEVIQKFEKMIETDIQTQYNVVTKEAIARDLKSLKARIQSTLMYAIRKIL